MALITDPYTWVDGDPIEASSQNTRFSTLYTETYQRLRPPNTLQPRPWNDLPPWLQAVWVEKAIWLAEMVYDSPEDQEQKLFALKRV